MDVKLFVAAALIFSETGCAHNSPQFQSDSASEVRYYSLDRTRTTIFVDDRVFLERPSPLGKVGSGAPVQKITLPNGVQCISIGGTDNSIEYAIKRPIKLGETYKCNNTEFRVVECVDSCLSAVIEIQKVDLKNSSYVGDISKIFVDACVGVVMFQQVGEGTSIKIFDSPALVDERGILASDDPQDCVQ